MSATGGVVPERPLLPMPAPPWFVETKIVAGSLGWMRIAEMLRPPKAVVVTVPPPGTENVKDGLIGPLSVAVVATFWMRYRPTPKKQLAGHPLASPVPTHSVV